jgi:hypothetical protein
MTDRNLTSTGQAAAVVQAPTTQGWADDMAADRCTVTHTMSTPTGDVSLRCDGSASHGGNRHQCHYDQRIVHWTSPA